MGNEGTIEQLRAAKEYLFEHGWTQREFQADDGSVCLVGAVGKVAQISGEHQYHLPTIHALNDQLANGEYCWQWNDQRGRTFDEVVDLIDATIKGLES